MNTAQTIFFVAIAALINTFTLGARCAAADTPAAVPVRKVVLDVDLYGKKEELTLCFVSIGGMIVRAHDTKCPTKKGFDTSEALLLRRLHAKRDLLKGFTLVFTKYDLFVLRGKFFQWAAGVTYASKPWHTGKTIRFIVVTTEGTRNCSVASTVNHELGHAAFGRVGLSSDWLDEPDDTPCTYDDGSALRRIVMTPGEELPEGPIRKTFEDFEH